MSNPQHGRVPSLWNSIRHRRSLHNRSSSAEPQPTTHQPEVPTSGHTCTCHPPKEGRSPQTLDEIDERIEALQSELRALRTARNRLAPFHRLPQEIIHMIFANVVSSSPGLHSPCILASVCSHWRAAALGHPLLWSYIVNTPSQAIEMQLARALGPSAGGRLHVTYLENDTSYAKELLLTLKHLSQIQSLDVKMQYDHSWRWTARYRQFFGMLEGHSAPQLKSLSLSLPQWRSELVLSLFIAPQLAELSLLQTPLAPFRALFGRHLRRLCVDNIYSRLGDPGALGLEVEEWAQALTLHPVLEELSLAYAIVVPFGRPLAPPATTKIHLPHLRRLHLADGTSGMIGLMRRIDVSTLYGLSIHVDVINEPNSMVNESFLEEVKRLAKSTLSARPKTTPKRILTMSGSNNGEDHASSLVVTVSMDYSGVTGERNSRSVELKLLGSFNEHTRQFARSISNTSFFQMFKPSELRVRDDSINNQEKNAILRILGSLHSIRRLVVIGSSSSLSPLIVGLCNMEPRRKERLMSGMKKLVLQSSSFDHDLVGHIIGAFVGQGFEEIEVISGKALELEFLELLRYITDRVLWDGSNN